MESLELELAESTNSQSKDRCSSTTSRMETEGGKNFVKLPDLFEKIHSSVRSGMLSLPLPISSREDRRAYLELEMKESQRAAFRNGTSSNYLNYLGQYEVFCDEYGYEPFPLKEIVLSMFAQYLSKKMKPQSIKAVLSGIRTVATTAGYEVTPKQFPLVNITLKGLGKLKKSPPEQAHPMTVRLLLKIRENMDINDPFQATMWALFLSCFCMLLRKSNVTPDKEWETEFMHREHIKRGPVGYIVTLYWTKTLQAGDRRLEYPLLEAPGCLLCPVNALDNMIKLNPAWQSSPAFCHPNKKPIRYSTFNNYIKNMIKKVGLSPVGWSTHSFRRGGTSYLAACGISERQIQILGDWKSDCYKKYIHCPWQDKLDIATKIRDNMMNAYY